MKNKLKNDIKLIAFDIDGTLLNDDKEISRYTIDVLNRVSGLDVKLVPITGRPAKWLPPEVNEIREIDYIGFSNGALIKRVIDNSSVGEFYLRKETALKIYDMAVSFGQSPVFFINGYIFRERGKKEPKLNFSIEENEFKKRMDAEINKYGLRNAVNMTSYPIECISIRFDSVDNKYKYLKDFENIDKIALTYSKDYNITINADKVTKGNCLKIIADLYNIDMKKTMVAGDGVNDIDMIEKAGIGVVMGNALKELKDYGDYVSESNNDDGLAKAIEKIIF